MKATVREQTVAPAQLCTEHDITPHIPLAWIDDGETIRVIPLPSDTIQAARGLTQGLCQRLLAAREQERQRG